MLAAALTAGPSADSPAHGSPAGEVRTERVAGNHLTLTSLYLPETMTGLAPGASARWDIGIQVHPPEGEPGTASVSVEAHGELPLQVTAHSCPEPWRDGPAAIVPLDQGCPAGARLLAADHELVPGAGLPLAAGAWLAARRR